jgi:hypothetical protein
MQHLVDALQQETILHTCEVNDVSRYGIKEVVGRCAGFRYA